MRRLVTVVGKSPGGLVEPVKGPPVGSDPQDLAAVEEEPEREFLMLTVTLEKELRHEQQATG